jgi:hypothetical protein
MTAVETKPFGIGRSGIGFQPCSRVHRTINIPIHHNRLHKQVFDIKWRIIFHYISSSAPISLNISAYYVAYDESAHQLWALRYINFQVIQTTLQPANITLNSSATQLLILSGLAVRCISRDRTSTFPADNSKIKLEPKSCTLVQNLPTQGETDRRVWAIYGCDEKGENCVTRTDD